MHFKLDQTRPIDSFDRLSELRKPIIYAKCTWNDSVVLNRNIYTIFPRAIAFVKPLEYFCGYWLLIMIWKSTMTIRNSLSLSLFLSLPCMCVCICSAPSTPLNWKVKSGGQSFSHMSINQYIRCIVKIRFFSFIVHAWVYVYIFVILSFNFIDANRPARDVSVCIRIPNSLFIFFLLSLSQF